MSFTTTVKNELCLLSNNKLESMSELSAIIRTNSYTNEIKIHTENKEVGQRVYKLIKDIYNISPKITLRKRFNFDKSISYIISVTKNYSIIVNNLNLEKNNILEEDEEIKRAYIRGLFISCGSINNPNNANYHLEFSIKDEIHSNIINNLLNEYNLNSKIIHRNNGFMIYIKEAEKIGDFLRLIKATKSLIEYENIRIIKDNSNRINRINNCQQANIDKVFINANNQIKDIKLIDEILTLDALDDKTRLVANYRLKYPESSLLELSNIISIETTNKISKSGLNHRLNKIKELASTLRTK